MGQVAAINTANFEQEVAKAEGLVLVDFFAPWCSHSRRASPVMESLATAYEGRVKVGKLDVFADNTLSVKYRIFSTPTVIVFKNGAEVARIAGSAVREGIQPKLDALLAAS